MEPTTQQIMIQAEPKTLLAAYGSRAELREFGARLQMMLMINDRDGNPQKMSQTEGLLLAAASLAHGLDPLNREIWLLRDTKGSPVIYTGPAAYVKAAAAQVERQGGGTFWAEYEPINDPDERAALLVLPGQIAWRCKLYDTPTITTYTSAISALTAAGAKWDEIKEMVGRKPYTEGIGVYAPSVKTKTADEKWNPNLRAQKRAYHAALKRRFSLPFVGESDGELPDEFTGLIPAEVTQPGRAAQAHQPEPEPPAGEVTLDGTARPAPEPDQGAETLTGLTRAPEPHQAVTGAPTPPATPLWARWAETVTEAKRRGLPVPEMDIAASDEDLTKAGIALRALIDKDRAAGEKAKVNLYGAPEGAGADY